MVKYCRKKRPHWGRGAEEAPSDPRGRLSCTPAPGTLVPGLSTQNVRQKRALQAYGPPQLPKQVLDSGSYNLRKN